MERLYLSDEDQIKIKTICEYLFPEQFEKIADFERFELCFKPLFNYIDISMEKVFKDICGPKKKYITYKRFTRKYLEYKNDELNSQKQTKIFFEVLINQILKDDKACIGSFSANNLKEIATFSNIKSCRKRDCISMIQVLTDKEGRNIKGINIEYDGVFLSKFYLDNLEENLNIRIEMRLPIIDVNILEKNMKESCYVDQGNYRDGITHIFGTIYEENEETKYITYLGFKSISGKIDFIGRPNGKGFLFGKFGQKFHDLKIQMLEQGMITFFKPGFKENLRKNFYLDEISDLNQNLDKEEIIKDEQFLNKMNDDNEIDKLVTTSIIRANQNINDNLEDQIKGYNYKEVVDLFPRKWILNLIPKKNENEKNIIKSIEDALIRYDEMSEIFKKKYKTMVIPKKKKKK